MNDEAFPGSGSEEEREGESSRRESGAPFEPEGSSPEGFVPTDLSRLFGLTPGDAPEAVGFNFTEPYAMPEAIPDADPGPERENLTPKKLYEKEVKVVAVYEQHTPFSGTRAFFVQLRDNAGRELKVYVGLPEATSISMATEGVNFRRPLTHDLTQIIIERMGWKIDRVTIDDLYNETFYAKLSLTRHNELVDIDCRPSDAIALALRARVPVYVAEEVLAAAAREDINPEEGDPPA